MACVAPPTRDASGDFALLSQGGLIDRFLRRKPMFVNAALCCAVRYAKYSAGFGKTALSAPNYNHPIPAPIFALLVPRQPKAVARLVIAIVVATFDRMTRRHRPHVGEEVLKLPPTLADRNAASTVVRVTPDVWVAASTEHVTPTGIFRSAASVASRMAVLCASVSRVASAAFRLPADKLADLRDCFISAVAAAPVKNSAPRGSSMFLKGNEPREPNANFANVDCHLAIIACAVFRGERDLRYG